MANCVTPFERIKRTAPPDVYYVVRSSGTVGRRDHRVISPLFETRTQADEELARLRSEGKSGVFSVWMRTTDCEPPEWLSDVIMADGTVVRAPR